MPRKQEPEMFYNYPDHVPGLRGVWKRLLHKAGCDPLTAKERIGQLRTEAAYWKGLADEMEMRAIRAEVRADESETT